MRSKQRQFRNDLHECLKGFYIIQLSWGEEGFLNLLGIIFLVIWTNQTHSFNLQHSLLPEVLHILALTVAFSMFKMYLLGINAWLPVLFYWYFLPVSVHFDFCVDTEWSNAAYGMGEMKVMVFNSVWVTSKHKMLCVK